MKKSKGFVLVQKFERGRLDNFKYITICSFYDYESVLTDSDDWIFPHCHCCGDICCGKRVV